MEEDFLKSKVIIPYLVKHHYYIKEHKDRWIHKLFQKDPGEIDFPVYVCPLCDKNAFAWVDEKIYKSSNFSEDHYPPKSVGGTKKALVCKICNSDAGGNYDHALKDLITLAAFTNRVPNSKIPVKSRIDGVSGKFTSELEFKSEGLKINWRPKHNKPIRPLDSWLSEKANLKEWKIHLDLTVADNSKVTKALLKTAYLMCFECWSYTFVYSTMGDLIRKVLNNEIEYPANVPTFWIGQFINSADEWKNLEGLCHFFGPENNWCYAANIIICDAITDYRQMLTVLIPDPTPNGWENLAKMQSYFPDGEVVTFTMQAFGNEQN